MLIFNSKEMKTHYMYKDDVVVEIHSMINPEEMLELLRSGGEITPDIASIAAFATNGGSVVTQAEYVSNSDADIPKSRYGYDSYLDEDTLEYLEEVEETQDNDRPVMFQAYEAFQFNRPWQKYVFEPCEITKEQLMTQLYAALGIMPTIKDIPEKSIAELKKISNSGNRLYWNFTDIAHDNKLPSRADIEFYDSLSDYEKSIINESGVHPMKMLDIARGIKENDPGKLLTTIDEDRAHIYSLDAVINLAKTPALYKNAPSNSEFVHGSSKDLAFKAWMNAEFSLNTRGATEEKLVLVEKIFNTFVFGTEEPSYTLEQIRERYPQRLANCHTSEERDAVLRWKKECEFVCFAKAMFDERVFPIEILNRYAGDTNEVERDAHFIRELFSTYRDMFEKDFLQKNTPEGQNEAIFDEETVRAYAQKAYKTPMSRVIQKSEEVFKELFHGHAPRVLQEYMFGQFAIRGIDPSKATETQIREIATDFNQKNVSSVAKYKSLVLFALADKLNFNEMKVEHLQALAIFVKPSNLKSLADKGFVEWYKANKDTNVSHLVELLRVQEQISKFDVGKSAKELADDINQEKGKADCRLMEQRYHYHFSDNELAIRGRHVVAQEGKMKMYMLSKSDYRNFTVGYDTHCCQHHGGAGETCVYKLTTDPFAGVVVIERDGKILAQGFVWTDESQDTLVFDNVEFADDRKVGQFNNLFAAWSRAMPYKNIHVGTGYNTGMGAWGKKITFDAILPTTLNDSRCYSDYHSNARSLKYNGAMQIQEKAPVKITKKDDEPTRWDDLARPETSFLLNDCHSSVQSRMEFARNFLNEQTPEIQMEAVRKNVQAIRFINDPTEAVQRYVIAQDPKLATLIKNPCTPVQELLLDTDPSYIRNIQNPSEAMVRKAVRANGLLLGDVANPSEVAQRIAVEQNGYAIKFVENQTDELQAAAVRSNPKVISLLREPSEEVQRMAVDADPTVISLIERPSEAIQLFAVTKNPYVINSIDRPEYSAVKKAVEMNGLLIRNFQYEYPHLKATALNQNGFAIRTIKNPTDEDYVVAVRQNRAVANIIRDPQLRANILAMVSAQPTRESDTEIEFE